MMRSSARLRIAAVIVTCLIICTAAFAATSSSSRIVGHALKRSSHETVWQWTREVEGTLIGNPRHFHGDATATYSRGKMIEKSYEHIAGKRILYLVVRVRHGYSTDYLAQYKRTKVNGKEVITKLCYLRNGLPSGRANGVAQWNRFGSVRDQIAPGDSPIRYRPRSDGGYDWNAGKDHGTVDLAHDLVTTETGTLIDKREHEHVHYAERFRYPRSVKASTFEPHLPICVKTLNQ
jgi:hypothetical protein